MREQRINLEGANETKPHPLLRRLRGDVVGAEKDAAGVGPQHSGHQIDERGLASPVRPDQRIADAPRQVDVDVGRDDERAEALVDAAGRERTPAHGAFGQDLVQDSAQDLAQDSVLKRCANISTPPRMPSGKNMTTAISNSPIQKYQYCGFNPENWSRATMYTTAPTSPP